MCPEEDLKNAVEALEKGGIILYPTDTIWGIGCDATNDDAVARLFLLKDRPEAKAMISLTDSFSSLSKWAVTIPSRVFVECTDSQRPVTVILDSPRGISEKLVAVDGSAGFRIPKLEFTRRLCQLLGRPVVSTSVNMTGKEPAREFSQIESYFLENADYVCQFGREIKGSSPSRILKISDSNEVTVIRE